MNTGRPNVSLTRAAQILREYLMKHPGSTRRETVAYVVQVADVHHSTVTRAISDASDEGHIQRGKRNRAMSYYWTDEPQQGDTAPRIVRIIPAQYAPPVTNAGRFTDAIAWGLIHCLREYA